MNKKGYSAFKQYIFGKKITIMGLGLLGRGAGISKFLAECGARLIITDLKTKKELSSSVKNLKKFKKIKYIFGKHRLEDFKNRDYIIKSAGVPLNSIYIKTAKKYCVPIEMDASFFAKFTESMLIGVTGTRGKSTVSYLIYEILKQAKKDVYLAGNIKGTATLPLLKKVNNKSIVILELDSWQLQGFGDSKISPHISVFINFMHDHMNYYKGNMNKYWKDKTNIYKYQNKNDYCICNKNLMEKIHTKATKIPFTKKILSKDWNVKLIGEHNKENIVVAIEVAKLLNISMKKIKSAVEEFRGVSGRLEKVKLYKGIEIYNDTNSTTPDATSVALSALSNKNIILICGGADKNLSYKNFSKTLPQKTKAIIFLPGTATEKIIKNFPHKTQYKLVTSLSTAVKCALQCAVKGDIVLFSPASASFGLFKNEYDRGEKFLNIIKKLK